MWLPVPTGREECTRLERFHISRDFKLDERNEDHKHAWKGTFTEINLSPKNKTIRLHAVYHAALADQNVQSRFSRCSEVIKPEGVALDVLYVKILAAIHNKFTSPKGKRAFSDGARITSRLDSMIKIEFRLNAMANEPKRIECFTVIVLKTHIIC